MKNGLLYTLLLLICLAFSQNAQAQMDASLTLSGNTITAQYHAKANYNTAGTRVWNDQVLTLRYPSTQTITFSSFADVGPFTFVEDPGTTVPVDGGDGYFYKVFVSSAAGVDYSVDSSDVFDLFTIQVSGDEGTMFELIDTSGWTAANNADATANNATLANVFGNVISVGNQIYDETGPTAMASSTEPDSSTSTSFDVTITFSEDVNGFAAGDLSVGNGSVTSVTPVSASVYTVEITPNGPGQVSIHLPAGVVTDDSGNANALQNNLFTIQSLVATTCVVSYMLELLPNDYYRVSMIAHGDYSSPQNQIGSAQVTIKVPTSTSSIDSFTVFDLTNLVNTGLVNEVVWENNSRYNAPDEDSDYDYISFGLVSNGTDEVPFVNGDTVQLFEFKNTGVCAGKNIYLMPDADPFYPPNTAFANVGQQMSIDGYNQPDIPICIAESADSVICTEDTWLELRAYLQGAYEADSNMMRDDLRSGSYLPDNEPYTSHAPIADSLNFIHAHYGGGEQATSGAFDSTGMNAIVDWVFIEMRDTADPTVLLATRSALVQRDGDIVDTDGISPVAFLDQTWDHAHIAVRHRNHMGVMTADELAVYDSTTTYDFTLQSSPTYGGDAQILYNGIAAMWAGNANADDYVLFQGGGTGWGTDIDLVSTQMLLDPNNVNLNYNHIRPGYWGGDCNLDGQVKYQGPSNDIDLFIFFNVVMRHPLNANYSLINFYIEDSVPRK